MYGYIYFTECLVNGKCYIGLHKSDKVDTLYFGSGKAITAALQKYGKGNFVCQVLEWCETREKLNEREKYWIAKCNAVNSDFFYNFQPGGEGGWEYVNEKWKDGTLKRRQLTEEQKQHLRKHHVISDEGRKMWGFTGKHLSEQHKLNLSSSVKNARATYAPVWNKGIPCSEQAKEKLRQHAKDHPAGRPVRCVETGDVFINQATAVKWLGFKTNKISACLNGHRETTGGYHWEYADDREVE